MRQALLAVLVLSMTPTRSVSAQGPNAFNLAYLQAPVSTRDGPASVRDALNLERASRNVHAGRRGLLVGALVGGIAAALIGNRICNHFANSNNNCVAATVGIGLGGAVVGGGIGYAVGSRR